MQANRRADALRLLKPLGGRDRIAHLTHDVIEGVVLLANELHTLELLHTAQGGEDAAVVLTECIRLPGQEPPRRIRCPLSKL